MPWGAQTLCAMAALTFALGACTFSVEETFSFESFSSPRGTVDFRTFDGAIVLRQDPTATRIHGSVRVRAFGFKSRQAGIDAASDVVRSITESGPDTAVVIEVVTPPGFRRSDFGVDLDLHVPEGAVVSGVTNDGHIFVDGLSVADFTTDHGSIDLVATDGNARLRTVEAPVAVDGHRGDLDIRTTQGVIELSRVDGGDIKATTTNGPIFAEALPPLGAEIFLATTHAPLELRLPFEFGAVIAATTTDHHRIIVENLDFSPTFSGAGQLEGELGDARGLVDVRTTFSDILVRARR